MNGFLYKLKVNPNIKILVIPMVTIVIVILTFILFAPQEISKLDSKFKELKSIQSEEISLNTKLDSLKSIPKDILDAGNISVIALPNKNPGIWVVSQAKRFSRDSEVEIIKINVSGRSSSGNINGSDVLFETQLKDYASLLTFLNDLTNMLPVTDLKVVYMERDKVREIYKGKIQASFYWSDFPTELPALDEPVKELTADENSLIGVISGYKQPLFIELQPGEPQDRPQPFQ